MGSKCTKKTLTARTSYTALSFHHILSFMISLLTILKTSIHSEAHQEDMCVKKAARVEKERKYILSPHLIVTFQQLGTAAFVFRCVTLAPSGGRQARSTSSVTKVFSSISNNDIFLRPALAMVQLPCRGPTVSLGGFRVYQP